MLKPRGRSVQLSYHAMLSQNFAEVKKLRSAGNFASALPLVHSSKIESDEDAFEAMICLFVSGNLEAVLGQAGRHRWESKWSRNASQAMGGRSGHKDSRGGPAPLRPRGPKPAGAPPPNPGYS